MIEAGTWQYDLILSLSILLGVFLLRWIISQLLLNRIKATRTRYVWKKAVTYLGYAIILFGIISIWSDEFQSAATFLGLVSAGFAIVMKDPIVNFFGWSYLMISRPFEMGDRIGIDQHEGDVLDINFFEFTLMEVGLYQDSNQSTGRLIHIPNGKVFIQPIINATQGFEYIWDEIPVTITFESNWEKAKDILLNIEEHKVKKLVDSARKAIRKSATRYNVRYSKLTPTVYTNVKENGICLTLRYLCPPRSMRSARQLIWEAVLTRFKAEPDIHFAYPTQRLVIKDLPRTDPPPFPQNP